MKQVCLGVIVAASLTLPAFGQGVDALVGVWKLNNAKSTSTVPLSKSLTLTITGEGQSRTLTGEVVDANSQSLQFVFQHIYDGQPHPTAGSPDNDSSAYTRIGNTVNIVLLKNGKPVLVGQGVIVPGKTWTVTEEGIDLNNQPFHGVRVYDRQ
jgi:hypothetical protein